MTFDEPLISPHALRDADFGFGLLPFRKGPLWRLLKDYQFYVRMPDGSMRGYWIPEDYQFDKASTPPILWGAPFNYTPDGVCTTPSLEHDFLCDLLHGGSDWLESQLAGTLPEPPPASVVHDHFAFALLALVRDTPVPVDQGLSWTRVVTLGLWRRMKSRLQGTRPQIEGPEGMRWRKAVVMGLGVKLFGPQGRAWPWVKGFLFGGIAWAAWEVFNRYPISL